MAKIKQLRITKVDGTVHFAPASSLNMTEIPFQNSLAAPEKQSKIELVEFADSEKNPSENYEVVELIHEGSVIIDAKAIQAASEEKDLKIAALEAELAAAKSISANGAESKKAASEEKDLKKK